MSQPVTNELTLEALDRVAGGIGTAAAFVPGAAVISGAVTSAGLVHKVVHDVTKVTMKGQA